MASGGYPGPYEKGKAICGIQEAHTQGGGDVQVFHAGTKRMNGQLMTTGGRVLSVCALGSDLHSAQQKANAACDEIRFEGAYYRRDIGNRVMKLALSR